MIVIDMDMPKDCGKCKLLMQCKGYYYIENKLPDTCPIKCDIEDIKQEIANLTITQGGEDYVRKMAELYSLKRMVLEIIDKHISGKEQIDDTD